MSKNIVIFSDGTAQTKEQEKPTNVAKLFTYIQKDDVNQVACYEPGLGTEPLGLLGKAFGVGISRNIQESYKFIVEQYTSGDHIYLFGYSRGAYTVRSLSGFINMFGLLSDPQDELVEEAYNIYRKGVNPQIMGIERTLQRRKEKADAFRKKHKTDPCIIKFIGVWDTVGALGVPYRMLSVILDQVPLFRHTFHDTTISPNVGFGYHALSLDDERRVFLPTLWDETTNRVVSMIDKGRKIEQEQRVEQVWFAGAHGDVGGSNEKPGLPSLGDIPLEWMIEKAKAHGLLLKPDYQNKLNPSATAKLHDSRRGIAKLYRQASREESEGLHRLKSLRIHQSVFQRQKANNDYQSWIFGRDDKPPPIEIEETHRSSP